MTGERGKIRSFEDLLAWQEARKLAKLIYALTAKFPAGEVFGLTSQMRRAAVSVGANIAEGFSRRTTKDKCQFYTIAAGSLTELKSEAVTCKDLGYIAPGIYADFLSQAGIVGRLLTGLRKSGAHIGY